MQFKVIVSVTLCLLLCANAEKNVVKRALQKSHEKPQWLKWSDAFLGRESFDQVTSLVQLLTKITLDYLIDCTPIILYDIYSEKYDNLLLQKLFSNYPSAYIHGQITENYTIRVGNIIENQKTCISYIIFIKDVMRLKNVIGEQSSNKVVIVARSSQWRVFEFLSNERSQSFTNLLVIAKSEKYTDQMGESAYILYTHNLYTDALGSNKPRILTSWIKGNLSRPNVYLFPTKMTEGFSGHRFIVYYAQQPPYVIKRGRDEDGDIIFDGIEVRLVRLLSNQYNFTTDFREAPNDIVLGSAEAVALSMRRKKANIGIAGLYTIESRKDLIGQYHSQDCAAFVSLASTALPRYRAIMGPFHWTVWLTITFVYLFAVIPLKFSDQHTLMPLIRHPEELENMFWYVFGTFTNCFTFAGKGSWSRADKLTTRVLIGFYWMFTIIITACYTGSIIAFVTLPVYPSVIDTVKQLLSSRYQIGTLDKDGWQHWYDNSSDRATMKLLKNLDLVSSVEDGLRNTTNAFFWNYAFLGSRDQLDYIVRTNFTTKNKRSLLHISRECFVPYTVGLSFPKDAIYKEVLNRGVMHAVEGGLLKKIKNDVEWYTIRTSTGNLLAANMDSGGIRALRVEDRALNLDDMQGMFLLLGIGFFMGGASLLSEFMGGCVNFCKRRRKRFKDTDSIPSNPRSHGRQTARERLNSTILTNNSLSNQNHYVNQGNHIQSSENQANCIIHEHNNDARSRADDNDETTSSDSFIEEINRLFEDVFGEENVDESCSQEEIIDNGSMEDLKAV